MEFGQGIRARTYSTGSITAAQKDKVAGWHLQIGIEAGGGKTSLPGEGGAAYKWSTIWHKRKGWTGLAAGRAVSDLVLATTPGTRWVQGGSVVKAGGATVARGTQIACVGAAL